MEPFIFKIVISNGEIKYIFLQFDDYRLIAMLFVQSIGTFLHFVYFLSSERGNKIIILNFMLYTKLCS